MTIVNTKMNKQQGMALFSGLVILLIMTIVAVSAMEVTTMEMRMAKNYNLLINAFETSDSPRALAGEILEEHVYQRGWLKNSSDYIDFPDELQLSMTMIMKICYSIPMTKALSQHEVQLRLLLL